MQPNNLSATDDTQNQSRLNLLQGFNDYFARCDQSIPIVANEADKKKIRIQYKSKDDKFIWKPTT